MNEHAALLMLPGTNLANYTRNTPGRRVASAEILGSIALVPIHGVIARHEWWCGTDCAELDETFRSLEGQDGVDTVVLEIRSPGGLAWGIPESAERILALRESGKRVLAWIDPLGASAAYWLAAAADAVAALPSALVGSIGAVRAFYDVSAMLDREGVRLEAFTSDAEGKIRGLPGRETTEEDRRVLQESVDEIGRQFREFVSARRPLPAGAPDSVFSGDVFSGRRALELGLVDFLATDLIDAVEQFEALR